MRCYFHFVDGAETVHDSEGIEVGNLDEARHAAEAVKEMIKEEGLGTTDWSRWRLDVTDASGVPLFSIRLDEGSAAG